ncbi:putative transmembrane protein [Gregarina niphandrodes]|uniref:Transmembrane protein n=1 Tax=Gregarina niphandrodes TaxID=110365 RepID=A0A023B1F4_GRENI|nr:putative transmembrane protein [Gregarina niphandrodes]EZG46813.1 putative transmembrane protein [Gregarina niphandrodes]|eukprot:XP_011132237.1 putative transmembrane protein [Gregarina niphandrodes]
MNDSSFSHEDDIGRMAAHNGQDEGNDEDGQGEGDGQISRRTIKMLIYFGLILFCSGTVSLFTINWMAAIKSRPCKTCEPKAFDANNTLQAIQCLGEVLCYPIYHLEKYVTTRCVRAKKHRSVRNLNSSQVRTVGPNWTDGKSSRSPNSRSPNSRSPTSRSPNSRSPTSRSPNSRSPNSRSPRNNGDVRQEHHKRDHGKREPGGSLKSSPRHSPRHSPRSGAEVGLPEVSLRVEEIGSDYREYGYLEFEMLGDRSLPRAKWYHWIVPGCCDGLCSVLFFYGIQFTDNNTVAMIRCGTLLVTALLCIVWFKRDLRVTSWVGLCLIILGQAVGSVEATRLATSNHRHTTLGVLCALGGVLFSALLYVWEESMWVKNSMSPVEGVGWLGIVSLVLSVIASAIADATGTEKISEALYQLGSSPALIAVCLLFMLAVGVVNTFALGVISLGSALFTVTVLAARNVPLWLCDLLFGFETFSWLQCVSIGIISLGFLFYAHVTVRCFPSKWRRLLDADVHLTCHLVFSDSEDDDPDQEEEDTTHISTPRNRHSAGPHVVLTRDPDAFYLDDGQTWLYLERDVEVLKK